MSFSQIKIKAEDQGRPPRLFTEIPFLVILRDINDNPPKFSPPANLTLSVGEETERVRVGFVNIATDADGPDHSETCYYIYGEL